MPVRTNRRNFLWPSFNEALQAGGMARELQGQGLRNALAQEQVRDIPQARNFLNQSRGLRLEGMRQSLASGRQRVDEATAKRREARMKTAVALGGAVTTVPEFNTFVQRYKNLYPDKWQEDFADLEGAWPKDDQTVQKYAENMRRIGVGLGIKYPTTTRGSLTLEERKELETHKAGLKGRKVPTFKDKFAFEKYIINSLGETAIDDATLQAWRARAKEYNLDLTWEVTGEGIFINSTKPLEGPSPEALQEYYEPNRKTDPNDPLKLRK